MFRLFLALNLLLLSLYACKGGYDSCRQKIIDSESLTNQTINLSVKKHQRLLFSLFKPNFKILKHDPYLSLYLVEDKKGFKFPFTTNNRLTLGTATVNNKRAVEGKVIKHQIGLNRLANFSEAVDVPSILLTSCCSLEGLATPRGIIEKEYLQRFLNIKEVSYSDIGIRVSNDGKYVIVDTVNPFMDDNPFKLDDCILTFDGKKVKDASSLMRWILFSKVGSKHTLKVKRGSNYLTFNIDSIKRNGGGYLTDVFLEFLGISFDKNLATTDIQPKAKKYALRIGDILLKIDNKKATTKGEITKMLSKSKKPLNLLFQRDGFQFFVKVKSI